MLWRFIEDGWYQPNANGDREIQLAAFIGEVSLVRPSCGIDPAFVDSVKGGMFVKHGIAVIDADEVRAATGGNFRLDPQKEWPANAHVIFVRNSGGKNLKGSHPEVQDLTDIANKRMLVRLPKP